VNGFVHPLAHGFGHLGAIIGISTTWRFFKSHDRLACQLLPPHDAAGILATARDNMEAVVTTETYEIQHKNVTYQAAICHRCGAKMFPVELLEAHMDRHQLKDMYLESELKKLQYSMNRMR
jgi:ribosomal protein S27AE